MGIFSRCGRATQQIHNIVIFPRKAVVASVLSTKYKKMAKAYSLGCEPFHLGISAVTALQQSPIDFVALMALRLSPEAIASIIFGILQLSIGVVALWQQRRLRQMHRESPVSRRRQQ